MHGEIVVSYFKLLSNNFPGELKKITNIPIHDNWSQGSESKTGHIKYEAGMLLTLSLKFYRIILKCML
jgi:hypothetical protein